MQSPGSLQKAADQIRAFFSIFFLQSFPFEGVNDKVPSRREADMTCVDNSMKM